ncbi:MAG: hypothetical protein ACON4R_09735 [Akkermansiaceae bacterium]
MSRLTKTGTLAKSAIATFIGLAFVDLFFALVLPRAAFLSLNHGRPIEDGISFLFFWMLLLIPLGVGRIFLAWFIVRPVEKALQLFSASRTAYLAPGDFAGNGHLRHSPAPSYGERIALGNRSRRSLVCGSDDLLDDLGLTDRRSALETEIA